LLTIPAVPLISIDIKGITSFFHSPLFYVWKYRKVQISLNFFVMHSFDFQLTYVLVIRHSKNSFDCMLNENCSVFQSIQKNTAHQQYTSRGLASFSTSFGFAYLYSHNNYLLRQYHSSLFYSTNLFHKKCDYKAHM